MLLVFKTYYLINITFKKKQTKKKTIHILQVLNVL